MTERGSEQKTRERKREKRGSSLLEGRRTGRKRRFQRRVKFWARTNF